MKTLRLAIATTMAAAFVVFAQTPAQAYPVGGCSIGVSDSTPDEGDEFTVTVTASPEEGDTDFTAEYGGQSDSESNATSFTTEFEADDGETLIEATATREGVTVSCSTTINVDDDGDGDGDESSDGDDGDSDSSNLPDTGAPSSDLLALGLTLAFLGSLLLVRPGGLRRLSTRV